VIISTRRTASVAQEFFDLPSVQGLSKEQNLKKSDYLVLFSLGLRFL